jgi:hypothetical protein
MKSNQSPTANGQGQLPDPPVEHDADEHPRSPKHGEEQGREVPGFNDEGYEEAEVTNRVPS